MACILHRDAQLITTLCTVIRTERVLVLIGLLILSNSLRHIIEKSLCSILACPFRTKCRFLLDAPQSREERAIHFPCAHALHGGLDSEAIFGSKYRVDSHKLREGFLNSCRIIGVDICHEHKSFVRHFPPCLIFIKIRQCETNLQPDGTVGITILAWRGWPLDLVDQQLADTISE